MSEILINHLMDIIPFSLYILPSYAVLRFLQLLKYKYKGIKSSVQREVIILLLVFSLIFILIATIGGGSFLFLEYADQETLNMVKETRYKTINYIPFKDIILYLLLMFFNRDFNSFLNVIGNILLFCPFGFFISFLYDKEIRLKRNLLSCFILTLSIEITQYFLVRGSDINDIILNVFGAFVGYLVFNIFENILKNKINNFFKKIPLRKDSKYSLKNKHWIAYICLFSQIAISIILVINFDSYIIWFYRNFDFF